MPCETYGMDNRSCGMKTSPLYTHKKHKGEIKMKTSQKKNTTMLTVGILTLMISASSFVSIGSANAVTCAPPNGSHCYAIGYRSAQENGVKDTVTATSLSVPSCSGSTQNLSVVPTWELFGIGSDWAEVGLGTGYLNGACRTNTIYTFIMNNGVPTWTIPGSFTVGTQYTFSIDDTATSGTWVIKKNGSTLTSDATSYPYAYGFGETGGEITSSSSTAIPATSIRSISSYSGGWNLWGTTNTVEPTPDSPMWRSICSGQADYGMNIGSGSVVTC